MFGPITPFSQTLHAQKYRSPGESFDDYCVRYARATKEDDRHFRRLLDGLRHQRILPAGRQQRSVGALFDTTAHNCFVMDTIPDSMDGIMRVLGESARTLRVGGGVGMDFSTLRPAGDPVRGIGPGASATGPVSFMNIWNAMSETILSAGHRRGAMMGVLRVDHPDILKFVNAKKDQLTLKNFNISVAITDEFMEALQGDKLFKLRFGSTTYGSARASDIWGPIMESNWDWAEPGVLFIDRIRQMDPLGYCETISATNPCAEQPLPPNGACLLLSLNLVKYVIPGSSTPFELDTDLLIDDTRNSVIACDNVIDRSNYPLDQQAVEQQQKRRMGIGVTGMANAIELLGHKYASPGYLELQSKILETIRNAAYRASIEISKTKGPFSLFNADKWLSSGFAKTLPEDIRAEISLHGLRNGCILSIAPTGTISLCADNVSSGIEPPYALEVDRLVHMADGQKQIKVRDWALEEHGVSCRTADEISAEEHVGVMCRAQQFVDSSVSKTCNVQGQISGQGPGVTFDEFKGLYSLAYQGGAKGCTTFNINGKRAGIFSEACTIDPETGDRSCE